MGRPPKNRDQGYKKELDSKWHATVAHQTGKMKIIWHLACYNRGAVKVQLHREYDSHFKPLGRMTPVEARAVASVLMQAADLAEDPNLDVPEPDAPPPPKPVEQKPEAPLAEADNFEW